MQKWKWYVYIIECADKTFYTGMTWKPDSRWTQHISGMGSKYTSKHVAKKLVYLEEYEDFNQAKLREKQIKNWSQEKKRKLINGEWTKW